MKDIFFLIEFTFDVALPHEPRVLFFFLVDFFFYVPELLRHDFLLLLYKYQFNGVPQSSVLRLALLSYEYPRVKKHYTLSSISVFTNTDIKYSVYQIIIVVSRVNVVLQNQPCIWKNNLMSDAI